MSDEIDDFIRRAAERRRQGQQGQRKQQQQQRPAQPPPPAQPKRARLVEPEVVEAQVVEDVAAHVNRHLDNQQFQNRASHLGEQPAEADDKVAARLHQTFDHQLGSLASTSAAAPTTSAPATTPTVNPTVAALAKLLASPQDFRQAFILSEILKRPADNW
jgi:hypothetical protein